MGGQLLSYCCGLKSVSTQRRGYGQGSIDQLGPDLWRVRVFVARHPVTGRPIQRGRRFHGTKAGAEKALNSLRLEVERDRQAGVRPTTSSKITLNEIIAQHLIAVDDSLSPGAFGSYESAHRLHLADGFGKKRVEALTAQAFRDLYAWLRETRNLSDSSVWTVYSLLSGALSRAVREQGLPFDSKQLITPRKPTRRKQQRATDIELAKVFQHSSTLGHDWPMFFRLACATGMRRGEIVALRWSTLDDTGTLYVDSSIVATKGALRVNPPKSGDARYVKLDDETVRRWNALKSQRQADARDADLKFSEDLFVFPAQSDGTAPRRPDRVTKVWELLRSELAINPKLEFRALRNWHITLLDDDLGFDLAKISRRVGHSQRSSATAMTNSYSLSDRKVDAEMADGVASYLAKIDQLSPPLPEEAPPESRTRPRRLSR